MNKENYIETINGVSFKMIFVEGGEVYIGQGENKSRVAVPDFYFGETPVTQALWRAVMGEDPVDFAFKGDERPVERVSWLDIVMGTSHKPFLNELSTSTKFEGYKLPSAAMWQYAAQGGCESEGFIYAGSNNLNEVGWYNENSHSETKPVKLKQPNVLGLYDMSGNVWEWCDDFWEERGRIACGGSLLDDNFSCRVTYNSRGDAAYRYPNYGFRIALY